MTKERKKGKSFVSGAKGSYEIQPPIVHPANCECASSLRLPADVRVIEHVIRLKRKSPFPSDLFASSSYARELKKTVEAELLAARGQSDQQPLLLPELCELYFSKNPRMVSAATIERDCISAMNLCTLMPGHLLPDEIDEPAAVDFRNARLLVDGARPRSVLNELSFLKTLLKFGFEWQRLTGMRGVRLLKVPDVGPWESDGVALTKAEFRAVLGVLSETNRRRMIFGVTTMLRRTPLLALKQSWIDPERGWLSVPAEMMKKGRSRRRTPLEVPIAAWALEQTLDLDANEHGYLWPSATGKPLTRVHDIFANCAEDAGVRPFSCHDLRTTGATWLRDEGVDELIIAILLGHKSTFDHASGSFHAPGGNVTRLYTRVYESAMREAVGVFDRIRLEIDPPSPEDEREASDTEFESAVESFGIDVPVTYWNQRGSLVAHTGFEPVLPP
jgi:integrase